jgi:hypothetical protein
MTFSILMPEGQPLTGPISFRFSLKLTHYLQHARIQSLQAFLNLHWSLMICIDKTFGQSA